MYNSHANSQVHSGTIGRIEDHGTVVLVLLRAQQGWLSPIFFDHRSFGAVLQGEACSAADLIGRSVEFDGSRMFFTDREED